MEVATVCLQFSRSLVFYFNDPGFRIVQAQRSIQIFSLHTPFSIFNSEIFVSFLVSITKMKDIGKPTLYGYVFFSVRLLMSVSL